jgi:SAM-dependent methyltransferase
MTSEIEFAHYAFHEERHWWYTSRRQILSVLLDFITQKDEKSVLEIGCGTGGNLKYLFGDFRSKAGLDQDPVALQYARKKLKNEVRLLEGDANKLVFPPNSFDCVALLDVLYHKNIADVDQVLQNIYNILTLGGYLLITDGAFHFLSGHHSKSVGSIRRFTRQSLSRHLIKCNFRIIRISYWGFTLFFILFLKRCILEKFLPQNKNSDSYDFSTPSILDKIMLKLVVSEKKLVKWGIVPFGASICLLAQKTPLPSHSNKSSSKIPIDRSISDPAQFNKC